MIVTLVRGVARNVSFGLAMTTHQTMMPPTRSWDVRRAGIVRVVDDGSANWYFCASAHTCIHHHKHSIRNLFLYYVDKGILLAIPIAATVYMGLLFLFVTTNFFLSSFVDPGIYPRGECTGGGVRVVSVLVGG